MKDAKVPIFFITEIITAVRTQLFIKDAGRSYKALFHGLSLKAACTLMKFRNGLVMVTMNDNICLDKSEIPSTKDV